MERELRMNAENAKGELFDRAREIQARVGPQLEQGLENLQDMNQRAMAFIRERPGTCLVGALAFGFIVGKIAARR